MSMAHTQKMAGFRESAIKLGIAKSVSVVRRCRIAPVNGECIGGPRRDVPPSDRPTGWLPG